MFNKNVTANRDYIMNAENAALRQAIFVFGRQELRLHQQLEVAHRQQLARFP